MPISSIGLCMIKLYILGFPLPIWPSKLSLCCTCRSRDKGVVSLIYAAVLATKGAPLCHQSWKNEAKSSRPVRSLSQSGVP